MEVKSTKTGVPNQTTPPINYKKNGKEKIEGETKTKEIRHTRN